MAKFNSIRSVVPIIAMIALAGSSSQLRAQEQCPELARLRSQVAETVKRSLGAPSPERCEAYVRISMDWAQAAQYASDHRSSCGLGEKALSDLEKRHREAVQARDNICAGRPGRSYPPDIISP